MLMGGFIKPSVIGEFLKAQRSITNVATNPSSSIDAGTVEVRRNFFNNPELIGTGVVANSMATYSGSGTTAVGTRSISNGVETMTLQSLTGGVRRYGVFMSPSGLIGSYSTAGSVVTYSIDVTELNIPVGLNANLYIETNNGGADYRGANLNITSTGRKYLKITSAGTVTGFSVYVWFAAGADWTGNASISFKEVMVEAIDAQLPFFSGSKNSWQAADLTPSWIAGATNNANSILTGKRPLNIEVGAGQSVAWISTDYPQAVGVPFTRFMSLTDSSVSKAININDSTVPTNAQRSGLAWVRTQNAMTLVPRWGFGYNITPTVAYNANEWTETRRTDTSASTLGLGFVYQGVGNWAAGTFVDVGRHLTVLGDYKGGFFTGTYSFGDDSIAIADRWRAYLRSQGAVGLQTHELEIQWLRLQGFTGTFVDMFYQKYGTRDGARDYFNAGGFVRYNVLPNNVAGVDLTNFGTFTSPSGTLPLARLTGQTTPLAGVTTVARLEVTDATSRQIRIDSRNAFPVTEGKTYRVSVYARTMLNNSRSLALRWQGSLGGDILPQASGGTGTTTANTWLKHEMTLVAPAGAVRCWLGVINTTVGAGGYIEATGYMVEELNTQTDFFNGDTPSTYTEQYSWTGTPHASSSKKLYR